MGVINPSLIPDIDMFLEACFLDICIGDYFCDPVHQREFEEWKHRREENEQSENCSRIDSVCMAGNSSLFAESI